MTRKLCGRYMPPPYKSMSGRSRLCIHRRFEHLAAVAAESRCPEFAQGIHSGVGRLTGAVGTLAVGVVGALSVDFAVGGVEVEGIGVHGFCIVEPAFWALSARGCNSRLCVCSRRRRRYCLRSSAW